MTRLRRLAGPVALAASLCCALVNGEAQAFVQQGRASWYALTSITASGERCDPEAMTAAHPTLPFGTRVRVDNLDNGRSVVLRINDRGPFVAGRIIDVTRGAAQRLNFIGAGVARVRVTVIKGAGSSGES